MSQLNILQKKLLDKKILRSKFYPLFPKNIKLSRLNKKRINFAIIGEHVEITDLEEKKIFSDKSSFLLKSLIKQSSINLEDIFFTNVFLIYPLYDGLNFFLIDEKSNEDYIKRNASKLPKYKNFYIHKKWEYYIIKTKLEIDLFKPKVTLGLGEFVYWTLFDDTKNYKKNIGKPLIINKINKEKIFFIPSYEKKLIETDINIKNEFLKHLKTFKDIGYGGLEYF